MRKLKIFMLTALTMASLFSVRDKEVVITVPDTKPPIAEAYHQPDQTPQFSTPTTQAQQSKPTSNGIAASSQANNDNYYNYSPPSAQTEEFFASGSQPLNSPPPSNPVTPDNKTEPPPATNNNPVYLGLGGFFGDGGNGDKPVPQGAPGEPNSAPVINSFDPPEDPVPAVDEGASLAFSISATDPDNDTLTYSWKLDGNIVDETSSSWAYSPAAGTAGSTKTITAIVSDGTTPVEQVWTVNITKPGTNVYISKITQEYGAHGVDVVIQGVGFSTTDSNNIVKFGATQSSVVDAISANQLHATVPSVLAAGYTDLSVTVGSSKSNNYTFDCLKDTAGNVFMDKTSNMLPGAISLQESSIVRLSDIDSDKDMDLLIVDRAVEKVYLLKNVVTGGDPSLTDVSTAALPAMTDAANITDVKFSDVNRDGAPDMLIVSSQGPSARLLINNGTGVFTDAPSADMPALSGNAVRADLGDVNGDGSPDIIIAYKGAKDVLLINDGHGVFTKDTSFNLPAVIDGSSDIRFCDVDGDGDLDIITSNNEKANDDSLRNRIYINDGSGHFTDDTDTTNRLPAGGKYTEVLDIGDIKKDRAMDIIFADGLQNSVLINNGQGVFTDETGLRAPFNNVFLSVNTKLGDLNGDGNLDLIVPGESDSSLYMNDGTGKFNIDASIKLPEYISAPATQGGANIELVDLDGNGSLDIVIGGDTLYILMSEAVNKAPVLTPIGDKQVAVGTNLTFNVIAADPNGGQLDILAESLPSGPLPTGATFSNDVFSWTPAVLGTKTIKFTAREKTAVPLEDSEEINIEVLGNLPPELTVTPPTDSEVTLNYGESVVFMASATDPDTPIAITWTVNGDDFGGTPNVFSALSIAFGSGTHTVVVTATDKYGASTSKTWTVKVYGDNAENHAPIIVSITPSSPYTVEVPHGQARQITFAVTEHYDPDNIPDVTQTLTFKWENMNASGAYETIPGSGNNTSAVLGLGQGRHFIRVTLTDDASPPASASRVWDVTVTDSAQNHAPIIVSITPSSPYTVEVPHGQARQITFAVTEHYDPDNIPDVTQTLTFKWENMNASGAYETIPGSGNNTSAVLGLGQGRHFIRVTLTDDASPPASASRVWDVTVTETPLLPVAVGDSETATQGIAKIINVLANDSNLGADPVVSIVTAPTNGTADVNANNTITYTSSALFTGQATFTYKITNSAGSSGNATVTVTVSAAAVPPVAADDSETATQGIAKIINVLANDSNLGADPVVSIVTAPTNGTADVNANNTITYTSSALFTGQATFTYKITNSAGSSGNATVSIAVQTVDEAIEDIIARSFGYFWTETDNPETGFVRDRLLVTASDPTVDDQYYKASMAATGFGLAAMCIAAEKYGDGSNPDWQISKEAIAARVNIILDKLKYIQQHQADAGGDALWGKNGFFYHYVDIRSGERWSGSEVSSIDTAILIAGVLTVGEYFKLYDPDINTKAQQIYNNVNWKTFVDTTPGANYGRFFKQWFPVSGYDNTQHWDYNDESLLLYLMAIASPDANYAIEPDCYYAPWKDIGNYGVNGNPIVQTYFGSLFAYQFTHVFFDLRNMHDARNVDWWQNTTDATIANRQFCLDQNGIYGYSTNVWGISSAYDAGQLYRGEFGAPPLKNPSGTAHNGTINPSAVLAALPVLPNEAGQAIAWLKSDPNIWHGNKYGFVDSFRNQSPPVYSDYYLGIDLGYSMAMAVNNESGLIWNNFMNAATRYGTMSSLLTTLGFRPNTDPKLYIDLDDIGAKSQFAYGFVSSDHPEEISFNLPTVVPNSVYLLALHTVMNNYAHTYTTNVSFNLNGTAGGAAPFTHTENVEDEITYIEIPSTFLQQGENVITMTWQSGDSWVAWKNMEISSPIINNEWTILRSVHGNEYRLDETYYTGHFTKHGADAYKTFEQALNYETDPYTEILFYMDDLNHERKLTLTSESSDGTVYVDVLVNDELSADNVVMASTQAVTIPATSLRNGWNVIRLKIDNQGGKWIIWNTVKLELGSAVRLQPPTELVSAPFGPNMVNLRWKASGGTDVRYNIYRGQAQSGPYVKLNSTDLTSPQYQDTYNLDNNTTYYYVVTTFELDSSASESDYSTPTIAKTGEWALDFGDGMDPNAFGGTDITNTVYEQGVLPGGSNGFIRKVTLGGAASIGLNDKNMGEATKLLIYVKGVTGTETFSVGLKDSSNASDFVNFTNPSTTWTLAEIDLTKLNVSRSSLSQLIITSSDPTTLYLYDIRFKAMTLSPNLQIRPLNRLDQSVSTGVHFTNIDPSQASQYKLSDQVIKIDYTPPNTSLWKIRVYTNNSDSDMQALPYQRNGLLHESKKYTVPVKWKATDNSQGMEFTESNADSWTYLKDMNDLDIPGGEFDESWDAANVKDNEYTVIAYGRSDQYETWAHLPDGSSCSSPIYVYTGGIFKGNIGGQLFAAPRGDYNTTIYFELYNE